MPTKSATAKKAPPPAHAAELLASEVPVPKMPPPELVASVPAAKPAETGAPPANTAIKAAPPAGAAPDDRPDTAPAAVGEPDEDGDEDEADAPEPAAIRARPANDAAPAPGHHMMGRGQAIAPGGRIMPPPRAMAKAEIFEEGDHVVYPTHGVGKVERIATEEIAGHKLELIHITFEENRMTLRVPVAKARTAGLRKLATRKMFDEALAVLRGRARIKRTMWSRRAQEYEAKINSGDPLAIAEVVRDLHRNAGQPDQSFSERQIYEAAMDRLAAELAALDRIDKAAAAIKLAEFLKTVV